MGFELEPLHRPKKFHPISDLKIPDNISTTSHIPPKNAQNTNFNSLNKPDFSFSHDHTPPTITHNIPTYPTAIQNSSSSNSNIYRKSQTVIKPLLGKTDNNGNDNNGSGQQEYSHLLKNDNMSDGYMSTATAIPVTKYMDGRKTNGNGSKRKPIKSKTIIG